jgi:hypothetical protein
MTKEQFNKAKYLRSKIKNAQYFLLDQLHDFENGGRRHSHTPSKSSDLSEQKYFNEIAEKAKQKDQEQIEATRQDIERLEQQFANL